MKNRIMVGGKTLQLEDKELINLNMQINDISDISTRNSTYSNTINVPNNSHNQEIFEMLGVIGSTTRFPYQKIRCKYFTDGVAVITNGYLQITDITKDYYKVVMYDGIIDLSEALKDKYISDLDLSSSYDHTMTTTTYTNSFANTTGYVYAFADYGVESPVESLSYLTAYGSNSISQSIAQGSPTFYSGSHTFSLDDTANANVSLSGSNQLVINYDGYLKLDQLIYHNVTFGTLNVNVRKNDIIIDSLTVETNSSTNQNVIISVTNGDIITMDINGTTELFSGLYRLIFTTDTTLSFYEINDYPIEYQLPSLYVHNLVDEILTQSGFTYEGSIFSDSDYLSLLVAPAIGEQKNYTTLSIDFAAMYDGVSQTDFLKDIMQHYGLIVIKDNHTDNHLIFKTFEELLQDTSNAEDWTDKLVKIDNQSFSVNGYARNSEMKYKYESDVDGFDYDGVMVIDNEHLENNKTLFTSMAKIRKSNYETFGLPIYTIPTYSIKKIDGANWNVPKKTDITLFKIETVYDSIAFHLTNGAVQYFSGNIAVMSFVDVDYQYYIDNYYTQFKTMLDNNKKITVKLNLNNIDIYNLDFLRLKYLKQTGRYYYLNSVKSNGELTTAELIEINN